MFHSSCQQLCLGELVLGFYGFHSHFLLHLLLVFWRNSNFVKITVLEVKGHNKQEELQQDNGKSREDT